MTCATICTTTRHPGVGILKLWAPLFRIVFCVAFGLLGLAVNSARAEVPTKLLSWIPADANAVVAIDVDGLFHAPLAARENWKKQAGDRFANQDISVLGHLLGGFNSTKTSSKSLSGIGRELSDRESHVAPEGYIIIRALGRSP